MQIKSVLAALAVGLLLPSTTWAQAADDIRLAERVAVAVRTYPRYTVFDHVTFYIESGSVTLQGKVTMPMKKDEIAKRVADVDGVGRVNNEIETLPVSLQDDRLRRKASRAIYGHAAFWGYAARPDPPIHIIVEHGRVTLAGEVTSEVDRALAQSLATGLGEFSVTNTLRVAR